MDTKLQAMAFFTHSNQKIQLFHHLGCLNFVDIQLMEVFIGCQKELHRDLKCNESFLPRVHYRIDNFLQVKFFFTLKFHVCKTIGATEVTTKS